MKLEYNGVIIGGIIATSIFVIATLFPNFQVTSSLQLKDVAEQLILIFVIITALIYLISMVKQHHILHPMERGILGGLTAVYIILSIFAIPTIEFAYAYLVDFKPVWVAKKIKYY